MNIYGKVDEAQAALARKHLAQQEIVDKLETAEADKILAEDKLNLANKKMSIMQDEVDNAIKKRQEVSCRICLLYFESFA